MKPSVYQHKVLPHKALVTELQGNWVEFYIEDHQDLSYLERPVFESAYELFSLIDRPLYTADELKVLRADLVKKGLMVPKEFAYESAD